MAVQGCYPPRYRLPGKAHLSTGGEGLMIGDRPRRTVAGALDGLRGYAWGVNGLAFSFPAQRTAQEVLGRNAFEYQARITDEAEARVVRRLAEEHATPGATGLQRGQPCVDEGLAHPFALQGRQHGQRTEPVPVGGTIGDCDPREGDVTGERPIPLCDQRDRQRAGNAQVLDDELLGVTAVFVRCKCRSRQLENGL